MDTKIKYIIKKCLLYIGLFYFKFYLGRYLMKSYMMQLPVDWLSSFTSCFFTTVFISSVQTFTTL